MDFESVVRLAEILAGAAARYCGTRWTATIVQVVGGGIETVVCGASGQGAHSDLEWVDLRGFSPGRRHGRAPVSRV